MKKMFVLFSMLMIAAPVLAEDVMTFAYPYASAPYCWLEDGRMRGINIDIVNEAIGKRMNIQVSHAGYPWARANHLVQEGLVDALITFGPARTEWAEHSKETVIMSKHVLFVKTDGPKFEQLKKAKTLEDLKPFVFVNERGIGWGKMNLIDKGFQVIEVTNYDQVYRMLAEGRADANVNNPLVGRGVIQRLGLQEQISELITLEEIPFHLVVGKKSAYTKIIPQFEEVIREMKDDGTVQKIIDKYIKLQ